MNSYSVSSLNELKTCHEDLVLVCNAVLPVYDHKIIHGRRGELAQNTAFDLGYSFVRWPNSEHNTEPPELSNAVDIVPWYKVAPHIRWDCPEEFIYLAGHMMQAAAMLDIKIRWGGDWDRDHDLHDINKPFDLGHFERIK